VSFQKTLLINSNQIETNDRYISPHMYRLFHNQLIH